MQVKCILKARVNSQAGTSERTGNKWRTDSWVVSIPGNYERKICFDVRGEERCNEWERFFEGMPDKNTPVLIKFEINAALYDGRWFNRIEAWDIQTSEW